MLDLNQIQENTEKAKKALKKRKFNLELLDQVLGLHKNKKELIKKTDDLKAELNIINKDIPQSTSKEKEALMKKSKENKKKLKAIEDELNDLNKKTNSLLLMIPNLPDESVPEGIDENNNKEISKWGNPKIIENAKDHIEIGKNLDILDLERATKITGTRFSVLKGDGAKLERALSSFMLEKHINNGYTEIIPPYIVNEESAMGTGQLPKFEDDLFSIFFNNKKYYLIPTAEIPVTNYHRDEILQEDILPIKYCSLTPCFRSEAGSYGKDTKGIIRQHQFHKVELVWFSKEKEAAADLEKLTNDAESILQALELPYRKVMLCGGDLGFSSTKTYDLEVWIPSQNTYREISSCSWFSDFQARRMKIRCKSSEDNKKREFVNTLNGSGLAVGRTFVAILENYQQPDGSVLIPKALQPYMNGQNIIKKRD